MDPGFRPDVIAMIAASSALMLAGVPFDGPIAGLRIGRVNGEYKAFLSEEERVEVIAQMLSGSDISEAARQQARELLSKNS